MNANLHMLRATAELEEGVAKSGRKKKQLEHIGYDDFESFNEGDLAKISALLKSPKKSVKLIDKTMKGWNRERSTLPEDLHYSGHELVSLDSRLVTFTLTFIPGETETRGENYGDSKFSVN